MTLSSKRKKWTEEEERTLIDKYEEMLAEGTLAKMKTREKKFRPIAAQVNALYHSRDPLAFPWQWSWKDVSTKVQNMRHQYLLVKQKIQKKKPASTLGPASHAHPQEDEDQFDWVEGLNYWPNFLRYKDVFGDVALGLPEPNSRGGGADGMKVGVAGDGENGELGLGLGFEYEGEEEGNDGNFGYEEVQPSRKKQKKMIRGFERRINGFVASQLARLESRAEAEEERQRAREKLRLERLQEWEAMEKESAEKEQRRREEEAAMSREWEERMERRRLEWKKRMDEMLAQHRATMDQLQARVLHNQHSLINQLLGIVSQWAGTSAAMADHVGPPHPYLSQAMQSLHHVNGIVHGENGMVDGENRVGDGDHEDQFIVDE